LLFAIRDGVHWHKIYKLMFPNYNVHYFNASQNIFLQGSNNEHYIAYIKSLISNPEKTVYIDTYTS